MYTQPAPEPRTRPIRLNPLDIAALVLLFAFTMLFNVRCENDELDVGIRPEPAAAQDVLEDEERELALALAKICVNESSLLAVRPADCALIWQTIRRRGGETAASRLAWLREHSSCVLTDRPMQEDETQTNCRWSRGLDDSDAAPEGWPEHWVWSDRAVERWQQVRELSTALVNGGRPRGGWPCERRHAPDRVRGHEEHRLPVRAPPGGIDGRSELT
jgi:hypothetical protein